MKDYKFTFTNKKSAPKQGISFSSQFNVYDGTVPFFTLYVHKDGENIECGKLWGKGGVLSFEGDAEESAKVFFVHVIKLNNQALSKNGCDGIDAAQEPATKAAPPHAAWMDDVCEAGKDLPGGRT